MKMMLTRREVALRGVGAVAVAAGFAGRNAWAVAAGAGTDDMTGAIRFHTTRYEDTLLDIARTNRLGLIELMAANPGVDPWLPGENIRLVLPTAHILPDAPRRGLVVNVAELRLYYFRGEEQPVISLPLGVGREGFTTPLGQTKVVRKQKAPTWRPTANARKDDPELPAVVPPGPDNPLGDFALYLGWPTYLIHGTSKPWGVGRRVSRGCIRMYPEDIEWLFNQAPVGTPVAVVDQPVKLGRYRGDLYIEVHPSKAQMDQIEETGSATPDPPKELQDPDPIIRAAGPDTARLNWTMINWALERREGLPYRITQ
jgi:L,D-transpeptidase ErfK/SrfK